MKPLHHPHIYWWSHYCSVTKKFKNFLNLGECIIFSKVTYWKLFHYPNILLISRSQYPTKKVWVMLSLRETNPYNFLYIFQISHKLWNTKWSDPPVYDDATRRHHRWWWHCYHVSQKSIKKTTLLCIYYWTSYIFNS